MEECRPIGKKIDNSWYYLGGTDDGYMENRLAETGRCLVLS